MEPRVHLETGRLLLREWSPGDADAFAAMNADPEVMRFFVKPMTRPESDALLERIQDEILAKGFGLYAVEPKGKATAIGFVGLSAPRFDAPFMPAIEIGWRLAHPHWNKGFATEAARAVLAHAFGQLGLDEVVSFTTVSNRPSRCVMEKVGMARDPADDFVHPSIPAGHPLAPHVLYRIRRADFGADLNPRS